MPNAPAQIITLVENFRRNLPAYQGGDYKEEQLKQEFINPFFEALGWDVSNRGGAAPQYRDVIFEDSIKVGGGTRAPDYCYTLSGRKMFFVEAKKPSVNVLYDKDAVYQLRRYAWSAQLPLSILTNFEKLIIYESRKRPKNEDNPSTERFSYYSFEEYPDKWEEISKLFSKTAVLQGSIDKFVKSVEKKHGTQEVDDEFLIEIEGWRDGIAKNIALRNTNLSIHDLNFAVQVTIDRIIFLRMCEDRGIEPYGQLQEIIKNGNIYKELCKIYKKCDEKYNSGLFHFDQEKNRNISPDEITLKIDIDDTVLKEIIKNIYYPDSPYEFSVLSPEILGNIYERFLGKIIRLTDGHHAKVEEKPEVKKAGGVYYTPKYIVDYIVENTVGKLCEKKLPKEISTFRILDPACGSGSFLLGAYSYLLKYHLEYYSKQKKPERLEDQIYLGKNGAWVLTIKEKKRILLNNIYGVDIDPQAVEVTKLSLLLKVLEGENKDVFERQQKLWQERALPDLGNNIKCGNSLIGTDLYSSDISSHLEKEDIIRINAFDWNTEFKEIITNGGFDTIVGNPPYIRIQALQEWAPIEVEFYKKKYASAEKGNYDIYVVFVEQGLNLLNSRGHLGFILPHKFFNAKYGEPLRALISKGRNLSQLVHFGDQQVFEGATTYTCLLFLEKAGSKECVFTKVQDLAKWRLGETVTSGKILTEEFGETEWNIGLSGVQDPVITKMTVNSKPLVEVSKKIYQGLATSADSVYVLELIKKSGETCLVRSKALGGINVEIESKVLHPLLKGSEINRWEVPAPQYVVLFPYDVQGEIVTPIPESRWQTEFPLAWDYLIKNKTVLLDRTKVDSKLWWIFPYPKNLARYEHPKIIVQVLSTRGNFTWDGLGIFYFLGGGTAGGNAIQVEDEYQAKYLLAILNSKLATYYVVRVASGFRAGFYAFGKSSLANLPIRTINFSEPVDKTRHDKIVSIVTQMLDLHKQLSLAKAEHEKNVIQRQIDAIDKQIDYLVYELYGLTTEEIKIIEENTK